jgi:DNA-binding transcriptional ArsR family regulator
MPHPAAPFEPPRRGKIRDPRQIRALASAVRQEIVDTAQALGPCAVADLARELGRAPDALYYHVRALLRVGLLVEAGARGAGRRREALYATPSPGRGMALVYDLDDPENAAAVTAVVAGMLRATGRNFAAAYRAGRERRPGAAVVSGRRRNLWAARVEGWLDEEDLGEVNELLDRLRRLFERPRGAGAAGRSRRLHAFTFVIAPLTARPRARPRRLPGRRPT